jgi:hypothetical protein
LKAEKKEGEKMGRWERKKVRWTDCGLWISECGLEGHSAEGKAEKKKMGRWEGERVGMTGSRKPECGSRKEDEG